MRRGGRHPLVHVIAIGAIASAAGIALALVIDWFPTSAATRAPEVDRLWDILLIASVPIFVFIQVVILFSVRAFRMRPGDELKDGPPIHGNTRLEALWTVAPALLIAALVTYSYVVLANIERAEPRALTVNVVAQQFAWTFEYPRRRREPVRSGALYLPQGRPVEFRIRSLDVVHSFFVPAFRGKIDAVPGITTELRVTPTRRGRYAALCAELCGLGHAVMRASVNVVAPAEFRVWLARQTSNRPRSVTAAARASAR